MATYVILSNYTEQGIKSIKDAGNRLATRKNRFEKAGAKILASYSVMGQYDRVTIIEAPNDETIAAVVMGIGASGTTRTTTMRAFTDEEFVKIIGKIP
jgi:uncharacterized protein with GYD domain